MSVLNERRKFVRYVLPHGMLYVFEHYSARVGWVRDVGMGGLSFECNHEVETENISEVLDVFAYDQEHFYIPAVACQKIFWLNKGIRRRCSTQLNQTRCGNHFVSLTAEQNTRWHELIAKVSKYSNFNATVYDPFR